MAEFTWADVLLLIDGAGSAHLATATAGGDPHVSVVWAVADSNGVSLTMRTVSGKAGRLRSNPRVALMWEGNSAETYVWGDATLVTDSEEKSRIWSSGTFPFDLSVFYGGPTSPDWTLVRVTPTRAVAMMSNDSGMERKSWVSQP